MGLRSWRNLLNSDPSVDLVHFTILRPPNKQDLTPVGELSLIPFPSRELFQANLNDFDLIKFDQYHLRGILPQFYLKNVVEYVVNGGALLDLNADQVTIDAATVAGMQVTATLGDIALSTPAVGKKVTLNTNAAAVLSHTSNGDNQDFTIEQVGDNNSSLFIRRP